MEVKFISSFKCKSKILKEDVIDEPNILLIKLLLSNLVTDESFRHKVDCADVSLLINSAFFDIFLPNPQLVIIL